MDENIFFESATEVAARFRDGSLSPLDYARGLIDRIEASELNAFWEVPVESILTAAAAAERAYRAGDVDSRRQPLLGVPFSVKDNIETAGVRTSYGSRVFADNIPETDAVAVQRLKDAGGIMLGKTGLPEFATKGVVDSPLHGDTRNPWNPSRVVGGSSGGAAAAVAAGLGPLALGNDQAGSIRMPAALCGVAGIKPTSGRIPFAPNLSPWSLLFQVGLIARTIDDLELGLGVLEGPHSRDPLSMPVYDAPVPAMVQGRRPKLAFSASLGFGRVEPEVLAVTMAAVEALRGAADIADVPMDLAPASLAYSILVPYKRAIETGHQLEAWAEIMDPEVVSYIRSGMTMTQDDLRVGIDARTSVYHEVERVLADYDFIVTPTLSVTAFEIGLTGPESIGGTPTTSFRDWFPYTYPFNLSGHPAVSIPAGFTEEGLPVGLQIVGRRFTDRSILQLCRYLEAELPWRDSRPPFS